MARIRSAFLKCFALALLATCVKCNIPSDQIDLDFDHFSFEKMLNELSASNLIRTNSDTFDDSLRTWTNNDWQCLADLGDVAIGLRKREVWAIKLADSWGKLPSGFLNGNFYELGAFSQCFHIKNNDEHYKTQYCMGQSIFKPETSVTKPENQTVIEPFIVLPVPPGAVALTFGLCLPANCSVDSFQRIYNALPIAKRVEMNLPNNTCQLHESEPFELTTLDKATLGLLGGIFTLIVASTIYDILMTINNRETSLALTMFSFYTNGKKLLSYEESKSPEVMQCLNGIRVISTQWVVLGHTFLMYMALPIRNMSYIPIFRTHYYNMVITSALISVDTFFFISGLFASITLLKHLNKTGGKINIPKLYFHRYLRLTPLLGVSLLVSITFLRFAGNGPFYPGVLDYFSGRCTDYWWTTLLYVQNYVNPNQVCLVHTWYLSVDMQLFLCAPIVVYLIYRYKAKAIIGLSFLVLGCIGCTIAVHIKYELGNIYHPLKAKAAYFPTHIRFSSWLIGVFFGYFLYNVRNRKIRIPWFFNVLAWLLSLAIMLAVIFTNYPLQQFDTKSLPRDFGIYDALTRVFWSFALCYIVFACVHGYGGIVNRFLSHPLWQPLMRISYSVYLWHFFIIVASMASVKTPPYFSEFNGFMIFLGNYIITLVVATIATLAFESPVVIVEKLIFGSHKKNTQNQ